MGVAAPRPIPDLSIKFAQPGPFSFFPMLIDESLVPSSPRKARRAWILCGLDHSRTTRIYEPLLWIPPAPSTLYFPGKNCTNAAWLQPMLFQSTQHLFPCRYSSKMAKTVIISLKYISRHSWIRSPRHGSISH